MSNNSQTIMVVDDEAPNVLLMERTLSSHYRVITANSGAGCLELLETESPDLILLDVRMPGMIGYDGCKRIKNESKTKDIPVIFLSAYISLDDKLKGYDAGGDDYITKPCELEEVLAKVKSHIANNKAMLLNRNMAMVAMTNASELGMVTQFYEKSFACLTPQELSHQVIIACQSFGLQCCVQIRTVNETLNATSTQNQCTPLEIDLMNQIKSADRILHFGKRTAFNFDNITLIIKNMPRDDEDKCGRLNDHIASLINGAEARIINIDVEEQQRESIINKLSTALDDVNSAIVDVESGIKSRAKQTSTIIASLFDEMHLGFSSLALNEDQEEFFVQLVNNHMEKIISLYTSNTDVEQHFTKLSRDISLLMTTNSNKKDSSAKN